MTHEERRDRLRQELQAQMGRQGEIERALQAVQAQVLRLQGAIAVVDEIIREANGADLAEMAEAG
jgi:hypothetical protein